MMIRGNARPLAAFKQWCALFCSLIMLSLVATSAHAAVVNQVTGLDFKRGQNGEGILRISFQDNAVVADFNRKSGELELLLRGSGIKDDLIYVMDVNDFATPLQTIETFSGAEGARLLFTVSEPFEYDYNQNGNVLEIIVIKGNAKVDEKGQVKQEDLGKPISINFQDIPVRTVLQIIAEHNDFNLVTSDTVTGNVTMRVDGVPWKQVLDIILRVKGLDKRVNGNVMLVAPKAELDSQEHQELMKQKQAEELASLRSEVITINYAKADELAALLAGQEDGVSLLSQRGTLSVDKRTNSIVIKDLSDNLDNVKQLLKTLDIPVKQVEIEARIVTVTEGTIDELGVRWGMANRNGSTTVGSSISSNWKYSDHVDYGADGEPDALELDDFLNVNLAASNPAAASLAFQVAKLGRGLLLDLELSALESENKAEIVSSPRLITTNKMPAYIEQGTELPYLEASSSGATAISFKKAVLSLSVTPQITPNNKLVLDLKVTQDEPNKDPVPLGGGEALSISTKRIDTQVLANNGETVVLGGIFQHVMIDKNRKVPLLGDIPVLGTLFRHKLKDHEKRELLIFVTPKIVEQQ